MSHINELLNIWLHRINACWFTLNVWKRAFADFLSFLYVLPDRLFLAHLNPLTGTLKPRSNGSLYNSTVIGTLAVDVWDDWAGPQPTRLRPLLAVPNVTAHSSYNGLRTNFILFDVELLHCKGLMARYAMLAIIGPSVVRPVIISWKLSKIDTMEHSLASPAMGHCGTCPLELASAHQFGN